MSASILIRGLDSLCKGCKAVFNAEGQCIGVVFPSRSYPFKRMFFAYSDAGFYYGMTSAEAVRKFLDS